MKELNIQCGVYTRDVNFKTDSGIVILQPSVETLWVMFINIFHFDSCGCPPPTNIIKHTNSGICSEYQVQKKDRYCAAYCLYVVYLTNKIGFKNAVLNSYYRTMTDES